MIAEKKEYNEIISDSYLESTTSSDLSIIIPAYNEEMRIYQTLTEYINFFENNFDGEFEIVVVTDGCKDKTCEIISTIGSERIRHYNFNARLGKGKAISIGYEVSKGDIISYTDADNSTPPKQLHDLIKVLQVIDCDGVSASRYAAGGRMLQKQSLKRRIASRTFNLLIRVLFNMPFKDTQCGAKVFKSKVAKDIFQDLKVTDWAFDVNLLYNAHKRNFDIREIGIHWEENGGSRLDMKKVVPKMFLSIIRLRLMDSIFSPLITNPSLKKVTYNFKHKMEDRNQ